VLQRLVDKGNTVLVIEHNLDVLKSVDYIIDLGPDGGSGGGNIIATGTPEQVAKITTSYTGHYLQKMLEKQGKKS
jgi:excinuclease ABC subunit A